MCLSKKWFIFIFFVLTIDGQSYCYHLSDYYLRCVFYFIRHNDLDIIQKMIDEGWDLNDSMSKDEFTSLHFAATGYCEAVSLLLKNGADPNIKDSMGNTPLHIAAINNNKFVASVLLHYKNCRINSLNRIGYTPLAMSMFNFNYELDSNLDFVKFMVEKGAQVGNFIVSLITRKSPCENKFKVQEYIYSVASEIPIEKSCCSIF